MRAPKKIIAEVIDAADMPVFVSDNRIIFLDFLRYFAFLSNMFL